jgi:hypothetical protein
LLIVGALGVLGLIAATPFVVWWARDAGRIPGRVWYWSGHDPRPWQWAVLLGWFAGGVIAIVTVLRWRYGATRTELFEDLHERIAAHESRAAGAPDASVVPFRTGVSDAGTRSRRRTGRPRRTAAG